MIIRMKNNTIGEIIRDLRKRHELSQEELAEGICSAVSISRIENGTQADQNDKQIANFIKRFFARFHIFSALKSSNAYKKKRINEAAEWNKRTVGYKYSAGNYPWKKEPMLCFH